MPRPQRQAELFLRNMNIMTLWELKDFKKMLEKYLPKKETIKNPLENRK